MEQQPRCLIDTNILLRLMNSQLEEHSLCYAAIGRLRGLGFELFITLQNAAEFWNVSTRPIQRNGHGLTVDKTRASLDLLDKRVALLPDTLDVYTEWRRLVTVHQVQGVQVHDARLAAAMIVHEVP